MLLSDRDFSNEKISQHLSQNFIASLKVGMHSEVLTASLNSIAMLNDSLSSSSLIILDFYIHF